MSRKSILNISSEKKRDKLLPWSNSVAAAQSGSTTYTTNAAIITGGSADPAVFLYCPTARDNTLAAGGNKGTKFDVSTRTSSVCYMVGLSEQIQVMCVDALPWEWRRICFTSKGGSTLSSVLAPPSASFSPAIETSAGYTRVLNQLLTTDRPNFYGLFFSGQQNVDWVDPLLAKVDNDRVTVKYDKTIILASANEDGFIKKYSRYHRMGHNLVYDDDDIGGSTIGAAYSTRSKAGMGDYWIVDFFRPRAGSAASNQLSFGVESTLYWHER